MELWRNLNEYKRSPRSNDQLHKKLGDDHFKNLTILAQKWFDDFSQKFNHKILDQKKLREYNKSNVRTR